MKSKDGVDRPWLFRCIRALEALGLVVLIFGLASSRWLLASAGAIVTAASYTIYRRAFPVVAPDGDSTMGPGDGD